MAKYGRGNWATQQLVKWLKANGSNVCHLCGNAIDMRRSYPDPMAWSLDHLVPVSKGGVVDDADNARESHWECNIARGDMSMDQWCAQKPKGTFHLS